MVIIIGVVYVIAAFPGVFAHEHRESEQFMYWCIHIRDVIDRDRENDQRQCCFVIASDVPACELS